ncbi:DUF305 domain-containing protein [Pseudonocardia phyllosphaerae]|uniref:DUF305 domain-containing protein n=1 Tax=Pseudonocardia phyllosphaerae TaxID=3390502 RepID=UPI003978270D
MKISNTAAAAVALTAALVLTGCGGGDAPAPPAASASQHTDADVAFTQGMIPHHQQAVEMAKLADGRAGDDVRRLASQIDDAQGPEIAQMQHLLKDWGAPDSGGMPGMDHGSMDHDSMDHESSDHAGTDHAAMDHGGADHGSGGHDGMMTADQMRGLEQARGPAFDRQFLTMMIGHHEGAVRMSQTELADGTSPDAKALAQKIVDAQNREIGEMKRMLG